MNRKNKAFTVWEIIVVLVFLVVFFIGCCVMSARTGGHKRSDFMSPAESVNITDSTDEARIYETN